MRGLAHTFYNFKINYGMMFLDSTYNLCNLKQLSGCYPYNIPFIQYEIIDVIWSIHIDSTGGKIYLPLVKLGYFCLHYTHYLVPLLIFNIRSIFNNVFKDFLELSKT
jgi:hypothetical protein